LIQDAAYDALLKSRRRELHRRVALTIIDKFPDVAEAQPEVIARHWTEAGEKEQALTAWRSAADLAYERHTFREAEEAYRQALAILRTLPPSRARDERELELMTRFAHGLQLTRGWSASEAADAVGQAQALAARSDNLAQLVLQIGGLFAAVVS